MYREKKLLNIVECPRGIKHRYLLLATEERKKVCMKVQTFYALLAVGLLAKGIAEAIVALIGLKPYLSVRVW